MWRRNIDDDGSVDLIELSRHAPSNTSSTKSHEWTGKYLLIDSCAMMDGVGEPLLKRIVKCAHPTAIDFTNPSSSISHFPNVNTELILLKNPIIDWSKYPPPPRAPGSYQVRNLPPIVGKLRRQILLDISVAFGIGMTMGYLYWYGYHVPAVRRRDAFYEKLEEERIAKYGGNSLNLFCFN